MKEECFSEGVLNKNAYQAHNDVEVLSDTPTFMGSENFVTSYSFEIL